LKWITITFFVGRNIDFQYNLKGKWLSYSVGLLYHINNIETVPYGSFFKKSALAQNEFEKFGLSFSLFKPFHNNNFISLGGFYQIQLSRITELHRVYYAYEQIETNPDSEFSYSYIKHQRIFGPVRTADNTIGIKLCAKLSQSSYLNLKIGVGMIFWKNEDKSVVLTSNLNQRGYLFTHFMGIGYGFTFKNAHNTASGAGGGQALWKKKNWYI